MELTRTFEFRLEPTPGQRQTLTRFAGACRWVYNKALERQSGLLDLNERIATYNKMCSWLTEWRHDPDLAWLAEAPAQAQQHRLKDLARAFTDYFRPKDHPAKRGYPQPRKKHRHDTIRYPSGVRVDTRDDGTSHVFLPKLGWVRFRQSRAIPPGAKIAQATVKRQGDHWFITLQLTREIPVPTTDLHDPVGIDVGIAKFATFSDGSDPIPPISAYKRAQKKLVRAQRKLSRKQKGSANWRRQKKAIAKLHRKVAQTRCDFLHKTSTAIAKNHGVVILEDLKTVNMTSSGKGTKENPGKNVKAKSGLNRSILDQGWYMFRTMLAYKVQARGGIIHFVDPANTSRTCPVCGHVAAENRKTQSKFVCTCCKFSADADEVAAHNILRRGLIELQTAGHAVSGCGGLGRWAPEEAATRRKRTASTVARRPGISGL